MSLEKLVEEIIAAGGEAVAVAVDVTDSGAVTRALSMLPKSSLVP